MNYMNKMIYRRFGKTDLQMPVITCGGMRYQQCWQDATFDDIDPENQKNLEACVRRAVECGINHIETARGYGSSEIQLGRVLPSLPRDKILVQTKIAPQDSEDAFLKTFEISLRNLNLDYVDLLSIHGINNDDLLQKTLSDGNLRAAQKLQQRGLARHIGFSTHAPLPTILNAIKTDAFSYVNLHWYYFDQANWPAIEAAIARDMGILIISPNDKGGKLYTPPQKLVTLCAPLTPMGFNDLFCLQHPPVHTLSIGVVRPSDFDAHLDIIPFLNHAEQHTTPVIHRLEQEAEKMLGHDWVTAWNRDLPTPHETPGNMALYHILRMYGMAKAFDMVEYGKMRYNLLGNGGHWFPGAKADAAFDWTALDRMLANHPLSKRIPLALKESHTLFNAEDQKRLSESD